MYSHRMQRGGRSRTRLVTSVLVTITIAVFLYQSTLHDAPPVLFCSDYDQTGAGALQASGTEHYFVCRYGAIPDEIHKGQDLFTLLTALFLHGNWLHLAGNMLLLWMCGAAVERALGHPGFLGLYVTAGLIGHAAHIALDPNSTLPSIGASGAVSGVIGAYLMVERQKVFHIRLGFTTISLPATIILGAWIVKQVADTVFLITSTRPSGGVASEAHVSGLAAGVLLGALLQWWRRYADSG
jgi:membrane associated rhomboid family serine protease